MPSYMHLIAVVSKVWHKVKQRASYELNCLQVDITSLPTITRRNKHIATLVDYFSKWPETEPLLDRTVLCVALIYKYKNIFKKRKGM